VNDPAPQPAEPPAKPGPSRPISGKLLLGSMLGLLLVLMVGLYIVIVQLKLGGEEQLRREYKDSRPAGQAAPADQAPAPSPES